MVDLTITAASVQHAVGASLVTGVSGAAITPGDSLYLSATKQLTPALHSGTAAQAAAVGIAVSGAPGAGQPITYQTAGNVDLGATLTTGVTYVVGAAAGGIAPDSDAGASDFPTVLGVATTTSNLKMGIIVGGAARS